MAPQSGTYGERFDEYERQIRAEYAFVPEPQFSERRLRHRALSLTHEAPLVLTPATSMRIVAWNCCRGPMAKKLAALQSLRPDVAVLAEALPPERESPQVLWFPSNASRLGTQVLAFGPDYKLRRLRRAAGGEDLPNCVVPVRVTGPISFNLLAVWTWPAPSYTQAFLNGLTACASALRRSPAVVAGDFNGNPMFDKPKARMKWWTTGFSMLHESGLVSAYHHHEGVAFGQEAHATHHFLRKPHRPFHIDFCFIPQAWAHNGNSRVQVLHGPPWSALSDHFPVVVDVDVAVAVDVAMDVGA